MPHVKNHDEKHEKHDVMVFRFGFGVPHRAAGMISWYFTGVISRPVKLNHGSVINGINRA